MSISSAISISIAVISLVISYLIYRDKRGVKLTQSYTPWPTDLPSHNQATILPITNHKDRSVRINALFIKISNIRLKLPISPFTIEPYDTYTAQFNLHEIYGLDPNIVFSYMADHHYFAPPTIQVMSDILGEQYASAEIANLMSKIKGGKFSLEANTALERVKIKYKATRKNKDQIFSMITLDEAKNAYIDLVGIDRPKIDKSNIQISEIIDAFSSNSYILSVNNRNYQALKKQPSKK